MALSIEKLIALAYKKCRDRKHIDPEHAKQIINAVAELIYAEPGAMDAIIAYGIKRDRDSRYPRPRDEMEQ